MIEQFVRIIAMPINAHSEVGFEPSGGSPALCRAIEKTIRGCGFNTGHCQVMRVPEHTREFVVNAVHAQTLESWTVHGPNEQAAWIDLARQSAGLNWMTDKGNRHRAGQPKAI